MVSPTRTSGSHSSRLRSQHCRGTPHLSSFLAGLNKRSTFPPVILVHEADDLAAEVKEVTDLLARFGA